MSECDPVNIEGKFLLEAFDDWSLQTLGGRNFDIPLICPPYSAVMRCLIVCMLMIYTSETGSRLEQLLACDKTFINVFNPNSPTEQLLTLVKTKRFDPPGGCVLFNRHADRA